MPGKGGALAILIGKGKPPTKEASMEEESAEEGAVSEDLAMAGEDFKMALDSGDGAQIARAFRSLKTLCESEGDY